MRSRTQNALITLYRIRTGLEKLGADEDTLAKLPTREEITRVFGPLDDILGPLEDTEESEVAE